MIDRFLFEELPFFDRHAVWTNNAISNAFGQTQAEKTCRILAEWLHLDDDVNSINITFRGLALSPEKPNFVAAFSAAADKTFGGISLSTFFANHIVNLATKTETASPSDFDRGFLGVLFADIADSLFASIFPSTQVHLDATTLEEAEQVRESYVFVFDLNINGRADHVFLHLPASWTIPETQAKRPALEPDILLRFPIVAGFIPTTVETVKSCLPGDLLIPDHAIEKDEIKPTYPYAHMQLSDHAQINIALSISEEKWICTFLDKDLSMDDSITTLVAENTQLNIRILAGSVEIPLKEISSIQPGFTLELNRAVHEGVELEANGQVFAKGELVNVGGKLGVRIVSRV